MGEVASGNLVSRPVGGATQAAGGAEIAGHKAASFATAGLQPTALVFRAVERDTNDDWDDESGQLIAELTRKFDILRAQIGGQHGAQN